LPGVGPVRIERFVNLIVGDIADRQVLEHPPQSELVANAGTPKLVEGVAVATLDLG
jgi:hypothetical protein